MLLTTWGGNRVPNPNTFDLVNLIMRWSQCCTAEVGPNKVGFHLPGLLDLNLTFIRPLIKKNLSPAALTCRPRQQQKRQKNNLCETGLGYRESWIHIMASEMLKSSWHSQKYEDYSVSAVYCCWIYSWNEISRLLSWFFCCFFLTIWSRESTTSWKFNQTAIDSKYCALSRQHIPKMCIVSV